MMIIRIQQLAENQFKYSTFPSINIPSFQNEFFTVSFRKWALKWNQNLCQKWDSNPRLQMETRTLVRWCSASYAWVWRLRPLGHPDLKLSRNQLIHEITCHITCDSKFEFQIFLNKNSGLNRDTPSDTHESWLNSMFAFAYCK